MSRNMLSPSFVPGTHFILTTTLRSHCDNLISQLRDLKSTVAQHQVAELEPEIIWQSALESGLSAPPKAEWGPDWQGEKEEPSPAVKRRHPRQRPWWELRRGGQNQKWSGHCGSYHRLPWGPAPHRFGFTWFGVGRGLWFSVLRTTGLEHQEIVWSQKQAFLIAREGTFFFFFFWAGTRRSLKIRD